MGQTIRDVKITNPAFRSAYNTIHRDNDYRTVAVFHWLRGKLPIYASNFIAICFPPDIQDLEKLFLKAKSHIHFSLVDLSKQNLVKIN